MTAPLPKTCRYKDPVSGWPCRRSPQNVMHGSHDPDCTVPPERHHAYVAAIQGREQRPDDPFVRTSIQLRKSDVAYMHAVYGRGHWSLRIRQWIEKERQGSAA